MKKLLNNKRKPGDTSQRLLDPNQRPSNSNNVELGRRFVGNNTANQQPRTFYVNASQSAYQPPSSDANTGHFDPNNATTNYSQMQDDHHSSSQLNNNTSQVSHTATVAEGYKWDFCLVVPNPDHEDNKEKISANENRISYEDIVERLYLAKLQTFAYKSGDGDEIFVKIRAPLSRLQDHAQLTGMNLLMDPSYLKKTIDNRSHPIADDPDQTSFTPYQFIYGPYNCDRPDMFAKAHGYQHPFSDIVRTKLLMDIIVSDDDGCCALNLRKLVKDGDGSDPMTNSIVAYYPLHNNEARDELARVWFNWRVKPWEQPLDDVKEYLGEKVAFYFEFTAHYTTWLLPLAVAGVLVGISLMIQTGITGSLNQALLDSYAVPFYCIFVSFWSQLMIEYWKRKEARKAMEWGTSNFEEIEAERPEFEGIETKSIIDGKTIKFFPTPLKFRRLLHSYLIICGMMVLVVTCVSAIFYLQYYFNTVKDASVQSAGNTFTSILSAVQIIILNYYYSELATKLTDQENHRTDTEYDDGLIGKLFAFSFVNSYASLFFIAYIKGSIGEACNSSCMAELAMQLAIIFGSKLTIDKITTYVTLVLNQKMRAREEEAQYAKAKKENRHVNKPSKAELEKRLEEYDPSLGVLGDYAQIFIQFGYVTLFVAACPIAPLLAYFSNLIEIRSDGNKMLYYMRRTVPVGCQDIGTWLSILQMTAVISVVTNAGILCYTMKVISFDGVGTVWIFIGFQYAIFIAMAFFSYYVDDVPEDVIIQLKRQEYLVERAAMTDEDMQEEHSKLRGGNRPVMAQFDPGMFKPHEVDEGEVDLNAPQNRA